MAQAGSGITILSFVTAGATLTEKGKTPEALALVIGSLQSSSQSSSPVEEPFCAWTSAAKVIAISTKSLMSFIAGVSTQCRNMEEEAITTGFVRYT